MSEILKIVGPPGTGKTETLLTHVEEELTKTELSKIGYFSFTRKAAHEARDRAIKKFKFDKKDFKWFLTLHSCGYHCINLEGRAVMESEQYRTFGDKIGHNMNSRVSISYNEETGHSDYKYLNEYNLSRARGVSLEDHYRLYCSSPEQIEWSILDYVARSYEEYKEVNNYIDYTDMLYEAINEQILPELDVVFIDEAQDLNPLQWAIVEHFAETTKKMYLAGDDDQAIYRWLGADVERFINYPAKKIVLPQSFRLKKKIQAFAENIINEIPRSERMSKKWSPRKEEGSVSFYEEFDAVDFSKGQWLILGRDKFILNKAEEECRGQGLWYERLVGKNWKRPVATAVYESVIAWEKLRKGEVIDKKLIKQIFSYKNMDESYKDELTKLSADGLYDMDSLKVVFGDFSSGDWSDSLEKITLEDKGYLLRLIKDKEDFEIQPRIRISTIHGSKGGECEKVLLLTDMNSTSFSSYQKDKGDEQRVFYVGATRAKDELHVLLPQTTMHFKLD
tara:strand:- start:26 stop:1543 length:1518 start_codon:yes stop_codon:yes gene_type:complete